MTTRIIRRSYTPVNNETLSLRDMMNRLMENAFVSPDQWEGDWRQFPGANIGPALDVSETGEAYTIRAALPGWKPENVDITFEGGSVTLKGEAQADGAENEEQTHWHLREIRRSSFSRSVALPSEVEADKARAEFDNGMLKLTLPKAEAIKPKQIKITAK